MGFRLCIVYIIKMIALILVLQIIGYIFFPYIFLMKIRYKFGRWGNYMWRVDLGSRSIVPMQLGSNHSHTFLFGLNPALSNIIGLHLKFSWGVLKIISLHFWYSAYFQAVENLPLRIKIPRCYRLCSFFPSRAVDRCTIVHHTWFLLGRSGLDSILTSHPHCHSHIPNESPLVSFRVIFWSIFSQVRRRC